jgi:hypothetical protein
MGLVLNADMSKMVLCHDVRIFIFILFSSETIAIIQ